MSKHCEENCDKYPVCKFQRAFATSKRLYRLMWSKEVEHHERFRSWLNALAEFCPYYKEKEAQEE